MKTWAGATVMMTFVEVWGKHELCHLGLEFDVVCGFVCQGREHSCRCGIVSFVLKKSASVGWQDNQEQIFANLEWTQLTLNEHVLVSQFTANRKAAGRGTCDTFVCDHRSGTLWNCCS